MNTLRPKDIFFTDPYFELARYCGPAELRKTKRVEILGKWHRVPVLASKLLADGALTFSHTTGSQDTQRRLTFRMYEQTTARLFINTYLWTSQLQKEVYMGTIHIERYATMQKLHEFQYKGIIELVSIEQDDDIVDVAPEYKLIQEVKHAFALALGMYLLAVSDTNWVQDTATDTPAVSAATGSLTEKERDELQQLRKEKEEIASWKEELLRLRIESNNRKAVQAELQRLRQELTTERSERAKEKDIYEAQLRKKDADIENIKEKAAQQLNDMLAMRDELNALKAATVSAEKAEKQLHTTTETKPSANQEEDLSIPSFMSQHDYTRDLDNVLNCRRVSYIGGSIEWQQYVSARFPQLIMLWRQRDPALAIAESDMLIVHVNEGKTEEIKRAISLANEADCPVITTSAYNLNNMAKDILKAVQNV